MKTLILFVVFLSTLVVSHAQGWEEVTHEGREYVTAQSIKDFYKFDTMEKAGDLLKLENRRLTMKLTIGGRVVLMNDVKFIFDSKTLANQGHYLVSKIDLVTIIDPVLRPNSIRSSAPCRTVIIDPGHGGTDPGAKNALGSEKDLTLAVALILKKNLKANGFDVVMTRDADLTLSNAERVKIANGVASDAIFISIHFKSKPDEQEKGIETITCSYPRDGENRAGAKQQHTSIALAAAVHGNCVAKTGMPDVGIRRMNTGILAGIKHPAILLIGGDMSHAGQAPHIHKAEYHRSLATSIASAVERYRFAVRGQPGR